MPNAHPHAPRPSKSKRKGQQRQSLEVKENENVKQLKVTMPPPAFPPPPPNVDVGVSLNPKPKRKVSEKAIAVFKKRIQINKENKRSAIPMKLSSFCHENDQRFTDEVDCVLLILNKIKLEAYQLANFHIQRCCEFVDNQLR